VTGYSFSTDTSVALIIANTASPSLRFIRSMEPVVMIDVTVPAAVRMTTSDTTLSETIFSTVPGKRFRMLVLMANVLSHNFDRHHHAFVLVFHDVTVKHKAADNFRIGKRNYGVASLSGSAAGRTRHSRPRFREKDTQFA